MPSDSEHICQHCGQPIRTNGKPFGERTPQGEAGTHREAGHKGEPQEYDHRGKLLPRRTRMGGIIAPQ